MEIAARDQNPHPPFDVLFVRSRKVCATDVQHFRGTKRRRHGEGVFYPVAKAVKRGRDVGVKCSMVWYGMVASEMFGVYGFRYLNLWICEMEEERVLRWYGKIVRSSVSFVTRVFTGTTEVCVVCSGYRKIHI
jgi:hypothetical protein